MGNFSLVVNSKFKPFSFERYIQPYQLYGEAYKGQEDAISELSDKADKWEKLANKQTDKMAYAQAKGYADSLRAQADSLAKEGLSITSRSNLLNLKRRYNSEITPIETAYNAREEQRKFQEQALAQNPNLIFSREAGTTSLDEYMKNPALSYQSLNKESIRNSVLTQVASLAKEQNRTTLKHILGNSDYYEYAKEHGFSRDAVWKAITNHPDADKILTGLVENTVNATGVKDWKNLDGSINQHAIDQVYAAAREGLWGGVGTTESTIIEDWRTKAAVSYDYSSQLQQEAAQQKEDMYIKPIGDTGEYYNALTGMIEDKDGKIIANPQSALSKVGAAQDNNKLPPGQDQTRAEAVANAPAGTVTKAIKNNNEVDPASEMLDKYTNFQVKDAKSITTYGDIAAHNMTTVGMAIKQNTGWSKPGYFAYKQGDRARHGGWNTGFANTWLINDEDPWNKYSTDTHGKGNPNAQYYYVPEEEFATVGADVRRALYRQMYNYVIEKDLAFNVIDKNGNIMASYQRGDSPKAKNNVISKVNTDTYSNVSPENYFAVYKVKRRGGDTDYDYFIIGPQVDDR